MRNFLRGSLLAAAMGVGLGGGAITAGTAHAQLQANPALQTWLIEFVEPGLVEFQRDLRGASADRFNPREANTQAYMTELMAIQAERKADLERAAGRPIEFTHHYLATHSGVAARLSADEAEALRGVPGVARVEIDVPQQLDTFNGPTFIGAGGIWDGSNVPSGANARGQGMVAAILDSGLVSVTHPSFANDAACGFSVENPKVLSNLDCSSSDGTGLCNGTNPTDTNGHGTHTASTVAGNVVTAAATPAPVLPPGFTYISGVAPCAKVRSYKVCPGQSCPGADIQAGMNSVLLHGDADVMNFSISGGTSPWTDNDRRKLDLVDAGVFVAASAGNTSTSVPNPIGQVNHRGPWVLSVAASTHDAQASGLISVTGPGTPPGNTQNIAAAKGSDSPNASNQTNLPIRRFTGQPETAEGCTAGVDGAPGDLAPFPAGFFNGAAALISRGTCPFTTKITNAFNAGAALVIIRNNQAAAFSMATPGQPNVPAYSVEQGPGNALRDFVTANPTDSTINFDAINGDVLAGFSLRGPTPAPLADLTKPDITAPGVSIYAAYIGAAGYSSLSGTSMSGPHAAGSALLIKQVQPTWTDAEIKSALMMTAKKSGRKDNIVSDWDWDDVGSGRVDLTKAARAGLVMHETTANYLAANPATAGDVKTLNIPAVRNMNCTPNCSWTRTVRNTLPGASSWTTAGAAITPGFDVTVSPSSFSFTGAGIRPADTVFFGDFDQPAAPETQVLTITATPTTNLTGAVAFGEVTLTETGARSPQQHITVSIRGQGGPGAPEIEVTPASVSATGEAGGDVVTAPLTIGNTGGQTLNWSIAEAPTNAIVLSTDNGNPVPAGGSPITLQVDDNTAENGIGVGAAEFLWLNRFTPSASDFPITLNQVQVLFRTADNIPLTDTFDVVLYSDADGDPANGATFVTQVTGITPQALDTFTVVNLPGGAVFNTPGDILVGLVYRTGFAADKFPASIDQTAPSQGRSWGGFGGTIASPPVLPTATFGVIDSFGAQFAGNWMVRATGVSAGAGLPCDNPADVPWLSVAPTSGSTAGGASSPVTVSMDPAGLSEGTYEANLCVTSNDPANPLVSVPVTFEVEDGGVQPEIVVFDNVNFTANADGTGGSIRWLDGLTCQCDGFGTGDPTGLNFNIFTSGGNIAFFWPSGGQPTRGGVVASGAYSVLTPGTVVGPASTWATSGTTVNWRQAGNVDGYLGFRFTNTETSQVNYGYARIQTTGTTGNPATIVSYAYNRLGNPITIPTASVTLDEGFEDITTLAGDGWIIQNTSSPVGTISWFQGNDTVFPAHQGDPTHYIGVNFNSVAGTNTISNWLVTPLLTFNGSSSVSFWTRSIGGSFPDRLQVRLCTAAPCTNVGTGAADVGAFTTMLAEINPGQTVGGYPDVWTQYTLTSAEGLPTSGQGRVAMRYYVTNGGPSGTASNYIGIDTVSITAAAISSEGGEIRGSVAGGGDAR